MARDWEKYDTDCNFLRSKGFISIDFTYSIPDDEDYTTIFVKGDLGLVFAYYTHSGWASFKYSDANYHNGLPDNYESINIYAKF